MVTDVAVNYLYRIGARTGIIGRPAHLYRSSELLSRGCTYGSLYAVRVEDAQAIEEAGSAAGYKGVVWSQRLWVDFDNEEASTLGRARLKELGYDHVVYTTGGRGCHIGILRSAAPSHLLPSQDKLWAATNLPGCDLSLYWHLHLIRLPGALHERTGLSKRLLYRVPGRELVLPPYDPSSEVHSRTPALETDRKSLFQDWEVMSRLGVRASNGDRHRHLVLLAKAIRDAGVVSIDEMSWMLSEVNRGFSDPKSPEEIISIAKWAVG